MKFKILFVILFYLTVTIKPKSCYEIGHVYNYVFDSNIEIYSSRNLRNSSLPRMKNSTRVKFSLEPIGTISSDLLITKLKVGI